MQDDFIGLSSDRPVEKTPCRHCGQPVGERHYPDCPYAVGIVGEGRRYYEIGYEAGVRCGRDIPRARPTTARTYLVVIQDPKGYPQSTDVPPDLIEPVVRQAVLREDYEAACERIDALERQLDDTIEKMTP